MKPVLFSVILLISLVFLNKVYAKDECKEEVIAPKQQVQLKYNHITQQEINNCLFAIKEDSKEPDIIILELIHSKTGDIKKIKQVQTSEYYALHQAVENRSDEDRFENAIIDFSKYKPQSIGRLYYVASRLILESRRRFKPLSLTSAINHSKDSLPETTKIINFDLIYNSLPKIPQNNNEYEFLSKTYYFYYLTVKEVILNENQDENAVKITKNRTKLDKLNKEIRFLIEQNPEFKELILFE